MTDQQPAISVKKLNKYFGKLHVLKDVDMDVMENEVVVLIGASGSGKSTLLRCLNFLEMKNDGDIMIEGETIDPKKVNLNMTRQRIGMEVQHFNLFPHKTVMGNIMAALIDVKKIDKSNTLQIAESYLDAVAVADIASISPSTISGGQKQRVAIARELARWQEMILFDETTSELNPGRIGEV